MINTAPTQPLSTELTALAQGADAPAVPVADRILARAIEAGASDLHLDPEPEEWTVRLRLDGVLNEAARLNRALVPTLVARLKVLADLPTYVVDVPQDGRIPKARVNAPVDLRLSILPTIHGEKAVVRLFDPSDATRDLAALGLPDGPRRALETAITQPQGVVVLCGPAGSGKSTTIHAALRSIVGRSGGTRSIVGIEDPVERVVPGITQSQVNAQSGFGFPQALKAFLRQDPQVIYVGEARDAETAGVAIQAGLTGHLVITTLHAGSCAQVYTRLLEMRIEPHLITSAITLTLAQRLVRKCCADCAGDSGCPRCQFTGYRGRIPLIEHLVPSTELRDAVLGRADETQLSALQRETLLDHAACLVREGKTTTAEIERVLGTVALRSLS